MFLGQRVRLRPVERDDIPRFIKWLADVETRAHLGQRLPVGHVQEEKWFEHNAAKGDLQTWAIDAQPEALGPWTHIGSCGFHDIHSHSRVGEVGIFIGAHEYWGKGYGTDAMETLVAVGFGMLNLNRIQLRVFDTNPRAIRSYEKVGFTVEGRLRQENFYNGVYRDTFIMGLLRAEWEARRAAQD